MPLIAYRAVNFAPKTRDTIAQAQQIVADYARQGYDLTLRQLYYQFVSRGLIANRQSEYKRLGGIINDARYAGLIDWNQIVDRTREEESNSHWESPEEIISASARQFRYDLWANQRHRPEVWVEKEALAGVFERVCRELDITWFSCRGYGSASALWRAAQRLRGYAKAGQKPVVLHFGDHDPSGIDMTRDIQDRLAEFGARVDVRRLALNMDQVEKYNPPPNPAKETDSRFRAYMDEHGDESWELDALEPDVLANMVRREVATLRDRETWGKSLRRQEEARALLLGVSDGWSDVTELVKESGYYDAPEIEADGELFEDGESEEP